MDGSNGKIVELLERIAAGQGATLEEMQGMRREMQGMREEQQGMREEQQGMREEQHRTRTDIRSLRETMRHGFEQVNVRIDNLLSFIGSRYVDHEQRIRALEERVGK